MLQYILMNRRRPEFLNITFGLGISVPVAVLLLGIQMVAHDAVQLILAISAGAIVMGGTLLAQNALPLDLRGAANFEFPRSLRPIPPLQLIFAAGPLLIVTLLTDPPASLVGGALLGALALGTARSWWRVLFHKRRYLPVGPRLQEVPDWGYMKFSEGAHSVLSDAQQEARLLNHNYIGTEHILMALVREPKGAAGQVLRNLGLDLAKVRSTVEFAIGRGDKMPLGLAILTNRTKKVIELAVDEARHSGRHVIDEHHFLIALIREGEGVAAGVLHSMDADEQRVRGEIARLSLNG